MTQTSTTTTNTEIIPTRVAADHYRTQSFTDPNKAYDQHLDYILKRWNCNCPDFDYNKNLNCKHIILLRAYIKREKAQAPEQHSTSVELVQTLARISSLEHAQDRTDGTLENLDNALCIKEDRLGILQGRLTGREYQIDKQQKDINLQRELIGNLQQDTGQQAKQIERQADLIGSLQTSVCRLNERTINQDTQIQQLLAALDQQRRMVEDQAQQIDALHDQVSTQQKASEQVVRVVIDQPAPAPRHPQQVRQERLPAEDTAVKQVSKTECKVGKFTVEVKGNCAASCNCSIGKMGRQCGHMVDTDKFLSVLQK